MRKPQAGACGVCGRAVVRPDYTEVEKVLKWLATTDSSSVTTRGHEYDLDGRLVSVRCYQHEGKPEWDYHGVDGV